MRWGPVLNRGGGSDADHDGVFVDADAGRGCNGGYCACVAKQHSQAEADTSQHGNPAWKVLFENS